MSMRKITVTSLFFLVIFLTSLAFTDTTEARTRVRGYWKPSTGTYVMPHYRSSPNRSVFDNWSTKGNLNPYTGKWGTRNPYRWP
jgi:hypothetical protein